MRLAAGPKPCRWMASWLRSTRRVCRPGGTVAARDGDYAAMTWFPRSDALERWLDEHPEARARTLRFDVASLLAERGQVPVLDVIEGAF